MDGTVVPVTVKVHNPEQSAKRKCDDLLPLFESKGVMNRAMIGQAKTLVFDAAKMQEVMIDEYRVNGVTMYTPQGE
jgi:aminoglycoside 3-N-acetyltransferase